MIANDGYENEDFRSVVQSFADVPIIFGNTAAHRLAKALVARIECRQHIGQDRLDLDLRQQILAARNRLGLLHKSLSQS